MWRDGTKVWSPLTPLHWSTTAPAKSKLNKRDMFTAPNKKKSSTIQQIQFEQRISNDSSSGLWPQLNNESSLWWNRRSENEKNKSWIKMTRNPFNSGAVRMSGGWLTGHSRRQTRHMDGEKTSACNPELLSNDLIGSESKTSNKSSSSHWCTQSCVWIWFPCVSCTQYDT